MDILLIVVLGIFGALLGSFACAQVWRLRARQLVEYKQDGEEVDMEELARLRRLIRPVASDRSECLTCHHRLAWYDLVPIFSWLSLGGRCRYCHSHIGWTELGSEIGLAVVFIVSYVAWPYPLDTVTRLIPFVLWLVACTIMSILFIYDAKWSLLPFSLNIALIVVAVFFRVAVTFGGSSLNTASLVGAIMLLGGLYLLFSLFGWAGMGDGILGIALALLLGNWPLAFLTLFIANLLGCLMLIPLYVRKQLHRKVRVPFGPFLMIALVCSMLFGQYIISYVLGSANAFTNLFML